MTYRLTFENALPYKTAALKKNILDDKNAYLYVKICLLDALENNIKR